MSGAQFRWFVIGQSCQSCGGEIAIKPTDETPTRDDEKDVCAALGGMFCIVTKRVAADAGVIVVDLDELN